MAGRRPKTYIDTDKKICRTPRWTQKVAERTEMNYSAKDIEKAKELKSMGYNWIATNKNGRPFAYGRMPYRCADDSNEYNIWENQPGTPWLMLSKEDFKFITWENEPVYVDEIITGVKVQANGDTAIERLTAERDEWKRRAEKAEQDVSEWKNRVKALCRRLREVKE